MFLFLAEEMSQPEGSLRGVVFGGNPPAGPRLKRLRESKSSAGTSTKSPAKEKEKAPPSQGAGAILPVARTGPMPPPPQRSPLAVQDGVREIGNPATAVPDVRIPVDHQDLERMPEAFRGTVYESASYAVSHFYKLKERELRAIESTSPIRVMESSMDMTLTGIAAVYRGIARTKAQLEGMEADRQTALQEAQEAKDALAASKAELKKIRSKNQELKNSLTASRTDLEAAKTEAQAAQAALEAERVVSEQSLQDLFYNCWSHNPDADFSFMPPDLWAFLLPKLQARLNKEAPPSETGEAFAAAGQDDTATSRGPTDGA
ncbi:uncharacterized protein LOC133834394 [Humulus lupulus]|uniref:uncharacterized protein LOC133834394 n=1 Tax=Humulus lupulus TaxID=3486 RepID=UPI002B413BE7|nr:uncharacterized protein LOC133834394 [Humulus lupulus]